LETTARGNPYFTFSLKGIGAIVVRGVEEKLGLDVSGT
jgi:hypothetical protein